MPKAILAPASGGRYNPRQFAKIQLKLMNSPKQSRPKARLPRGFRDRGAGEIMAEQKMLAMIRAVYESYGFEPLETPAFEFTDALGQISARRGSSQ